MLIHTSFTRRLEWVTLAPGGHVSGMLYKFETFGIRLLLDVTMGTGAEFGEQGQSITKGHLVCDLQV